MAARRELGLFRSTCVSGTLGKSALLRDEFRMCGLGV